MRILLAEDSIVDAELVRREVRKGIPECDFRVVENQEEYLQALDAFEPDLIISDYAMPQFDGLTALRLAQERAPLVPVIIITGSMNEDVAVECMLAGAANYVIKERLKRLESAVRHALKEKQVRLERNRAEQALRESEARLKLAVATAQIGVWEWTLKTNTVFWSAECYRLFGMEEFAGTLEAFQDLVHPEDRQYVMNAVTEAALSHTTYDVEYRIIRADGAVRWVSNLGSASYDEDGRPVRMVGTVWDITDLRNAHEEQRLARLAAEESNQMKSVFLANMSHEIRTPLTAIIGFADMLVQELKDDDRRDLAEDITFSGKRLQNTLTSILTLAQLEAHRFVIQPKVVDLCAEVRMVVEHFKSKAEQKHLRLVTTIDPRVEGVGVLLDPGSFSSTLWHLLDNAVKFTEMGEVTVSVAKDAESKGTLLIQVSDTGIGIAPDFVPDLFKPFVQGSTGDSRAYEGSGLGLAIADRLIEKMRGSLEVESVLGKGSRFTLHLPPSE